MTANVVPLHGAGPVDPLAAAFRSAGAQLGGGDGGPPPRKPRGDGEQPDFGVVVPLGTASRADDQVFVFLAAGGARIMKSARDLHNSAAIAQLFGGLAARAFLAAQWPQRRVRRGPDGKPERDATGGLIMDPTGDFVARDVGDALMQACIEIGPADAARTRLDGVWPGPDNGLVVHLGDRIRVWDGDADYAHPVDRPHGWRHAGAIHLPTLRRASPAEQPASAQACADLVARLRMWEFHPSQADSAPVLLAGMIAVGIYAGALDWRSHMWLQGPTNAGKSTLARIIALAAGTDDVSGDVSEAYVRNVWNGRARLVALDEREPNLKGVNEVLTLMRGASQGGGAVTGRVLEGRATTFSVACPFLLAAISTPAFETQDASRITVIRLRRPAARGADDREIDRLAKEAEALHPAIFARLIAGWQRFRANVQVYRGALLGRSATSRCADQLAGLLAGWATLVSDDPVDALTAADQINQWHLQVVTAVQAAEEDAPARVLAHLLSSRVPVRTGKEQVTVASLLEELRDAQRDLRLARGTDTEGAAKLHLKKLIRDAGSLKLRLEAEGDQHPGGLLVGNGSPMLDRAFEGTPWASRVWEMALRDVPGAEDWGPTKFSGAPQSRAWLIPMAALGLDAPGEGGA